MKKEKNEPKVKVYSRKCTELDILIIYRMMVLRLANHLSGQEVSFLMGKPLDYIDKIETFKLRSLLALDLYFFTIVLDFEDPGTAYPISVEPNNAKNNYEMVVSTYKDFVSYEVRQMGVNNIVVKPIFLLLDNNHTVERVYVSTADELEKLKALIEKLFKEGYFKEERSAYEIRYTCTSRLERSVKPKMLMKALQTYLAGKEIFNLIQRNSTKPNFNGFVYIEEREQN